MMADENIVGKSYVAYFTIFYENLHSVTYLEAVNVDSILI